MGKPSLERESPRRATGRCRKEALGAALDDLLVSVLADGPLDVVRVSFYGEGVFKIELCKKFEAVSRPATSSLRSQTAARQWSAALVPVGCGHPARL